MGGECRFEERHITIGIAGHVDHGKTSLVRCLTGIDTDRWQEEKRRGLSIESGVAPLEFSSGDRAALIDVPGHTDFLKNTIRGLSCVDAAVLVVAADDGVMPQTRDHLEILGYLGAEAGFVILSKADLVDDETLELAEIEIAEEVHGTFLQDAPIIRFSALECRGLEEIRAELDQLPMRCCGRAQHAPFRLWIDQVRSFSGFGTVVSGTVVSGGISQNDPVLVLPSETETRVRSIESHHEKKPRVIAGERAGLSLHKVPVASVRRGMALVEPGSISPSRMINVVIQVSQRARLALKNRQRVRLHLGTSVENVMVVLMEKDRLGPGEQGLAQVRPMKPVAAAPGDRFVISHLGTWEIIGGGKVLEVEARKFRKSKAQLVIPMLKALMTEDYKGFMDQLLKMDHPDLLTATQLSRATGLPVHQVHAELEAGAARGRLLHFGESGFYPSDIFAQLKEKTTQVVAEVITNDPLKKAVVPEEIRNRLAPSLHPLVFEMILIELEREGRLIRMGGGYSVPGVRADLSKEKQNLIAMILQFAEQSGMVPFSADTFWKFHKRQHNKNEIQRLLDYLNREGKLIRLSNRRYMLPETMERIKQRVASVIRQNGVLTIKDCNRVLGYGRTVGVPVFEYLDSIGFTERRGDVRVLVKAYNP